MNEVNSHGKRQRINIPATCCQAKEIYQFSNQVDQLPELEYPTVTQSTVEDGTTTTRVRVREASRVMNTKVFISTFHPFEPREADSL